MGLFLLQSMNNILVKKDSVAWYQWLMPVILAIGEAEFRKITIQSQPREIVHKILSQNTQHKRGLAEWLKW
jgi:hypothetical protein